MWGKGLQVPMQFVGNVGVEHEGHTNGLRDGVRVRVSVSVMVRVGVKVRVRVRVRVSY